MYFTDCGFGIGVSSQLKSEDDRPRAILTRDDYSFSRRASHGRDGWTHWRDGGWPRELGGMMEERLPAVEHGTAAGFE